MAPAKTADKAAATAKPLATKVTKETRPRRTTTRSSGGIKYRKRAQTKKANSEPEVLTIDDDNDDDDDDDDDDDVFNVEPSKPPVKGQGAKGKAELEKSVKEKSGPKIIKSIETELEFLKDSNVITPAFFDQLTNKLPARVESGQPPIDLITSDSNNTRSNNNEKQYPPNNSAPPAGPPAYQQNHNDHNGQEVVEVLYNYRPDGPTDLALHPGQRLVIVNKLNNDWWRGKDLQTEKEGIFPANYVKPINGGNNNNNYNNNDMSRQAYNPPPPSGAPSGPPPGPPGNNNNNYYPPPPQQQQYQPPPQQYNNNYYQPPYPPPSTNYYPPPQQQQQQQAPQPQQPQQQEQAPAPAAEHSNAFADGAKKIGGKLGNAAIFGAGSTLGSNLVNSIF
ncbi:hypothetical protein DV453_003075 [Geotrichum candidum]|nr:hypothetical protein DV453_003075 [Geotrichum candidum]